MKWITGAVQSRVAFRLDPNDERRPQAPVRQGMNEIQSRDGSGYGADEGLNRCLEAYPSTSVGHASYRSKPKRDEAKGTT